MKALGSRDLSKFFKYEQSNFNFHRHVDPCNYYYTENASCMPAFTHTDAHAHEYRRHSPHHAGWSRIPVGESGLEHTSSPTHLSSQFSLPLPDLHLSLGLTLHPCISLVSSLHPFPLCYSDSVTCILRVNLQRAGFWLETISRSSL